jgi:hypothetical protein
MVAVEAVQVDMQVTEVMELLLILFLVTMVLEALAEAEAALILQVLVGAVGLVYMDREPMVPAAVLMMMHHQQDSLDRMVV